jgi:hypothetical protein
MLASTPGGVGWHMPSTQDSPDAQSEALSQPGAGIVVAEQLRRKVAPISASTKDNLWSSI